MYGEMAKRPDILAAVAEQEARHPGLTRVISACLVGWDGLDIPRIVCQGLIVKVGEYMDLCVPEPPITPTSSEES